MGSFFSGLFGNEPLKTRLGGAIKRGTAAHAFLISGPEGSGKMTLAKEMAAAFNCERRSDKEATLPCHECNTCRRIFEDSFTDVKTLSKPKDKATIGVGEIRYFREDMFLSATESDYKIYIIDDAEKMTPNAQNALLKVLEEPPHNVVMILLTASLDAILTTIKSRTQQAAMQRFSEEELEGYFGSAANGKRELLMAAGGCIGKAKTLLGEGAEDVRAIRGVTMKIISAVKPRAPYSELYSAIRELPSKKDELKDALESLLGALRDLLLLKHDKGAPLVFFTSRDDGLAIASQIPSKRIAAIYDVVRDSLDDLSKNVNVNAMTTCLGARIKLI